MPGADGVLQDVDRHHAGHTLPAQRSMSTQTNRESILRHYKKNGGGSDGEESPRQENRNVLQENQTVLNSETSNKTGKSAHTGMDNMSVLSTARGVLRELQYPKQKRFRMSAATQEALKKAAPNAFSSTRAGNVVLSQALAFAMNDEFEDLARHWDLSGSGVAKVEDRVAAHLKKFATRAQKNVLQTAMNAAKDTGNPSAAPEETDLAVGERCALMEAELIAADQRIASLKDALQRPAQAQASGKLQVLADLSHRLSALQSIDEDAPVPGVAEIASDMEQAIQGIFATNAASRQMYQQCQEELELEQERNREFCPPASSSHQALDIDAGARSILRGIR